MKRSHLLFVGAGVLTASTITAQPASQPPTYRVVDAPAEFHPAIARGDLVIVSLQNALLSELRAALAAGGPARAFKACHLDVKGIAFRVTRREGLSAGRTSARLRNPANAPRPWAAAIVASHVGKRPRDLDGFVVDLGDHIGLIRPIVEQPICRPCHGSVAKMDPEVRALLPVDYPRDRAVDFDDGDVRGWYWIELPKR